MKTPIRPYRLWWCMSGVWSMVLQRQTLLKACKSLGPSGMKWSVGLETPCVRFSEETKIDALPIHTKDTFLTLSCIAFVCSYVVVMPKKRQALVEYEDMNGSSTAVTYAADNPVYIAGHPAFINYSTSQKISRPGDSDESRSVNHVLLLTIMNPIYPITTVNASLSSLIDMPV